MNIQGLKKILQDIKAAPLKDLSQNFLIDDQILETIIKKADLKANDQVLEIGPGLGFLTKRLLQQQAKVLAVEKDLKFYQYLKKNRQNQNKLVLINQDILKLDLNILIQRHFRPEIGYKIVANVPYHITSRLLYLFFQIKPLPQTMTLLLQKEVGLRICAKQPRNNPLALFVKLFTQPVIAEIVKKTSFYPEPKVDSAIVVLPKIQAQVDPQSQKFKDLHGLIKISFASPRKTLLNNLKNSQRFSGAQIRQALAKLRLGPKVRAQELNIEQYRYLNSLLNK
ncbi:MAG: ribosomal RNA small subunit methyltransferase A [Candidatus Moranbacteria bacterium]|nr:ribosomal RNA small subunit methyltransferase A [Candidatus Moranbacteria bacterium]